MRTSTLRRVEWFRSGLLLAAALSMSGCSKDSSSSGCYVCAATGAVVDGVSRTPCIGAEACSPYLRAGYLCQDPQSGAMPPFDPTDPGTLVPPPGYGTKQLLGFHFPSIPALPVTDQSALTITATAPHGTTVTALVAKFVLAGKSVTVNGVPQVSEVTANDFTRPVSYVVTALDGSTATYVVTVTSASVAPPAPTGVQAVAGFAQAQVSWTASPGAWSYSVYSSTSSTVSPTSYTGVIRTPQGSGVTSVPVGPLAIGTRYYFVVTADDGSLSSAPSSPPATAVPTASTTWTWVAGSDSSSVSTGVYGTKGVPADANVPPPRERAMTWRGTDGSLWLFGGARRGASGTSHFNDLWRFDGQRWTWVNGANVPDQQGALSGPGAREGGATWTDASGNLWLVGGAGRDAVGALTSLNDVWRYTVSSNSWSWMGGSATGDARGVYGTRGVLGVGNIPGARDGAAVWATGSGSAGTVWLFGGNGLDSAGTRGRLDDLWKFDGTWWIWVAGSNLVDQPGSYGTLGTPSATNVPGARSDAAAWTDASGNLWLLGGQGRDATGAWVAFDDLWKLDPNHAPTAWAWMGGASVPNQPGTYGTKGTPGAASWPGARTGAVCWADPGGGVWLFGGFGFASSSPAAPLNDLWRYDGTAWTWVSGADVPSQPGHYGTRGQPDPANVPGARQFASGWSGPGGSLLLFGGGQPDQNDLWQYLP
jgi:N-acetylneuraminic acid mutarotase